MTRELGLSNQIAVVTGAGRGIGRAIAERLALAGVKVAVVDIDEALAAETTSLINGKGCFALAVVTDISKHDSVGNAFRIIRERIGSPSILVNNAGVYKSDDLVDVHPDDWLRIIQVNLTGAFWCSQAIARDLMKQDHGRIINIASTGGKVGWPKNHAYCASKSGLIGLTRVLALELAPYGTTVNAVCPGNTDTEMMKAVDVDVCRENSWSPGSFARLQAERIPLRRIGSPDDVAGAVVFLCSKDASYISGQALNVDGGLVMY
jgi:NAD(P)-dependent dehydrogenase (short-subunit alcohol dehydrogenase family)